MMRTGRCKTRNRRGTRRGMAVMAVVMMFMLIGAAVLSMGLLFANEVRRTRAAASGAQLRQLLLAGTTDAQNELQTHGSAERDLTIKVPVESAQLHLHMAPQTTGAAVKISATLHESKSSQTVQFTRRPDGTWLATDATLLE